MAKITTPNIEKYEKQLAELGMHTEGLCKAACYEAAGIVADAIKAACPVDSGDLRDSIALIPYQNENGFIYTKVDFPGYDSRGVPNRVKARSLESGRSSSQGVTGKHPFVRQAVNSVKSAAIFSIEKGLDQQLSKYFK